MSHDTAHTLMPRQRHTLDLTHEGSEIKRVSLSKVLLLFKPESKPQNEGIQNPN